VFGVFDKLELEFVAAPPRLLVRAEHLGLRLKTLIEDDKASCGESFLDSPKNAPTGVVQVSEVLLNRKSRSREVRELRP